MNSIRQSTTTTTGRRKGWSVGNPRASVCVCSTCTEYLLGQSFRRGEKQRSKLRGIVKWGHAAGSVVLENLDLLNCGLHCYVLFHAFFSSQCYWWFGQVAIRKSLARLLCYNFLDFDFIPLLRC